MDLSYQIRCYISHHIVAVKVTFLFIINHTTNAIIKAVHCTDDYKTEYAYRFFHSPSFKSTIKFSSVSWLWSICGGYVNITSRLGIFTNTVTYRINPANKDTQRSSPYAKPP